MDKESAKRLGMKHYYTGKPCKHGHLAGRLVSDGRCVECCAIKRAKMLEKRGAAIKEYQAEYRAKYYSENKERCIALSSAWKKANKDAVLAQKLAWRKRNAEKVKAYEAGIKRRRYAEDPVFRCAILIRQYHQKAVRLVCSGNIGPSSSVLGYSVEEFKNHIERQFLPGMTWGNHGEWHVDHIVPIAILIAEGTKDPAVINRLSNLRPLWAKDNLVKGARMTSLL